MTSRPARSPLRRPRNPRHPPVSPEPEVCTICQDELKTPVQLECNHRFCKVCILKNLEVSDTCPNCRCHISPEAQAEVDARVETSTRNTLSMILRNLFCNGGTLLPKTRVPASEKGSVRSTCVVHPNFLCAATLLAPPVLPQINTSLGPLRIPS